MWVLAERENAEEVGYPVVWEEIKPAENEVPYNIREEQTIDKSSVFTANNDTTTWMANVIPWINAPKLISTTSIYWDLWWEYEEIKFWGNIARNISMHTSNPTVDFTTFTLSNLWGDANLTQWAYWIILPVAWWYEFTFTFPSWWSTFRVDTVVKTHNWLTLYSDTWSNTSTWNVWTFKWKVEENDELYIQCTLVYTGSGSSFSYNRDMSWTIIKM